MLELLCRLQAISSFAKDCHYHFNEYSQHLLADVNEDDIEKQIDLINEVCYLGLGEEAPAKKDILAGALDYMPQPSNEEKENFAKLKLMIKECLVHLEQTEAKTRGANSLLDNVAMTLQQLHGLLFKTVDDAKDIEYLNSLPDLMKEENYNESDEDLEWITVKGNHIPVKKGQSKREAIGEFIEKQEKKSYSIHEIDEERQKNPKSEKLQEMYKTNLKYRMSELQKDIKESKEKLSKTTDSKQKQKLQDEIDRMNFDYDIAKETYEKKYGEEKSESKERRTPKDRQDESESVSKKIEELEEKIQDEYRIQHRYTPKIKEWLKERDSLVDRKHELEDEDVSDTEYTRKKEKEDKDASKKATEGKDKKTIDVLDEKNQKRRDFDYELRQKVRKLERESRLADGEEKEKINAKIEQIEKEQIKYGPGHIIDDPDYDIDAEIEKSRKRIE